MLQANEDEADSKNFVDTNLNDFVDYGKISEVILIRNDEDNEEKEADNRLYD